LEEPSSNPNLKNLHINFKMSKPDQRFSQKGRTAQHWFIPVWIHLAAAVP
jgi:hypothetical protein